MKALSIRQPWAWLILHAGKDIENRTWYASFRGPVLIHAAKGMTQNEYLEAKAFAAERGAAIPPFDALARGGIVGMATMEKCVQRSDSPWFVGPYGFVLSCVQLIPFRPCKGALGFFDVDEATSEGGDRVNAEL